MKNKGGENKKTKAIEFGGSIPEIAYNPQEFIDHYKKYESQELKDYYKNKINEARKLNGLPPL